MLKAFQQGSDSFSPRAPPQPRRARRLSPLAWGCVPLSASLQIGETGDAKCLAQLAKRSYWISWRLKRRAWRTSPRSCLVLPPGDGLGAILCEATHKVVRTLHGSL